MTPERPLVASIFVVGANHRSSSMSMRDRLFVGDGDMSRLLASFRGGGIEEALLISTCDRIEVVAVMPEAKDAAIAHVIDVLAQRIGLGRADLEPHIYVHIGDDAVRHVFSVCCGLDSMVVGESQINGQIRASHRISRSAGMSGRVLETLLEAAYRSAKRVKSDTQVAERPVSLAAAAVDLLLGLHGEPSSCQVLLVGAGDFGVLIAEVMREAGLRALAVTHPRPNRMEMMARMLSCHTVDYETLAENLGRFDVVIGALGRQNHALSRSMVHTALKERRNRPILLLDVAIPGDVEPGVDSLEDAFVWTLDDLEELARGGEAARKADLIYAQRIVDGEADALIRDHLERAAVPMVVAMRAHFEKTRTAVLAECSDDPERATRLLVNRLLHQPTRALRAMSHDAAANHDELEDVRRLLLTLFPLSTDEEVDDEDTTR